MLKKKSIVRLRKNKGYKTVYGKDDAKQEHHDKPSSIYVTVRKLHFVGWWEMWFDFDSQIYIYIYTFGILKYLYIIASILNICKTSPLNSCDKIYTLALNLPLVCYPKEKNLTGICKLLGKSISLTSYLPFDHKQWLIMDSLD